MCNKAGRRGGRFVAVPPQVTKNEVRRTVEAVWRIESPRLIAGLAGMMRDVGVAEELAQDALVAALEQWPPRACRATRAPG
jgi:predicted RNA polymerase sigma factor